MGALHPFLRLEAAAGIAVPGVIYAFLNRGDGVAMNAGE